MPICPWCSESVPAGTTTCPECGEDTRNDPRKRSPDVDESVAPWLAPVRTSGWAIAAGYLGLTSVLMFPAPFALICSLIAIWHLRSNSKLHGWGRTVFGLVMGLVFTALLASFMGFTLFRPLGR
jgi:hypothetical protein